MTFPASTVSLGDAWSKMQRLALSVKSHANAAIIDLDSNVNAQYVLGIYQTIIGTQQEMAALAATSGLTQYVKDQLDDQGVDIVAEYQAMMSTLESAKQFIVNNFPKDGNGYILEKQFSSTGYTQRTFTPAQLGGLKSALQNVVTAIG